MGRCQECSTVSTPACVTCVEELEARLAGALGALERIKDDEGEEHARALADERYGPHENQIAWAFAWALAIAGEALADPPPAVARIQTIVAVMEKQFEEGCPFTEGSRDFDSAGCCRHCEEREACKAVRSKGG